MKKSALRTAANIAAMLLVLWLGFLMNGQTYVFDRGEPYLPFFLKANVPALAILGVFLAYTFTRKIGAKLTALAAAVGVAGYFLLDGELPWWFEPYLVKISLPIAIVAILLDASAQPSSDNAA